IFKKHIFNSFALALKSMKVKKLSSDASLPKRESPFAAGYDLFSAQNTIVPARGKALIKTDLTLIFPPGVYGRIAPRSGLALKYHLDIGGGVIDPDYRGNVGIILFNHGSTDYKVSIGDRIAQIILEKYETPPI